ncbi:MAG: M55 family metallopeptidase [Enterococcus sp.]
MKVFVSADLEGVAGISQWSETETGPWYEYFCEQLSREVAAACEGAIAAGATEIYVKDGHHHALNIRPDMLPKAAVLNRGWSGDGLGMMSGVQDDVDVAVMIGYHAASFSPASPLAHTSERYIRQFTINDERASEFTINRYTAAYYGVPVAFVSGDQGICDQVKTLDQAVTTYATLVGRGGSTTSVHPVVACEQIFARVKSALTQVRYQVARIPEVLDVKITYQKQNRARQAALFPGAKLIDPYTVQFVTSEYFEFIRFYSFVG